MELVFLELVLLKMVKTAENSYSLIGLVSYETPHTLRFYSCEAAPIIYITLLVLLILYE
jgi:hypothetical protein